MLLFQVAQQFLLLVVVCFCLSSGSNMLLNQVKSDDCLGQSWKFLYSPSWSPLLIFLASSPAAWRSSSKLDWRHLSVNWQTKRLYWIYYASWVTSPLKPCKPKSWQYHHHAWPSAMLEQWAWVCFESWAEPFLSPHFSLLFNFTEVHIGLSFYNVSVINCCCLSFVNLLDF